MRENQVFLRPAVGALLVIILFCMVMLVRGTDDTHYQVVVVVSDSSSERWNSLRAGLTQAARDNNIDLNCIYTDYLDNINEQSSLISEAITDGADGIITDFCLSMGIEDIVEKISSRVPVEFIITNVDANADVSGNYATVMVDNYAVGRAIGNELVISYGDQLSDMSIGIVAGNQQKYALQDRLRGLRDAIAEKQPDIAWTVQESRFLAHTLQRAMEDHPVQLIVGLDNNSLEAAVNYVTESGAGDLPLYGAGCSEKLVYYIDNGTIASMILPDEFSIGYQSLSDLAEKLRNRTSTLEDRVLGYNVVHRDNLFREENQRILFPIVQ